MADAYRSAEVAVHPLPLDAHLPYQVFARDSSFMTGGERRLGRKLRVRPAIEGRVRCRHVFIMG